MSFFVGQKVVCVDDAVHDEWENPGVYYYGGMDGLTRGAVYTVRGVCIAHPEGWPALYLEEIHRVHDAFGESPFRATRFRPARYKAMEIFRRIAADPKINIREDA